jgi:hypothetical protein
MPPLVCPHRATQDASQPPPLPPPQVRLQGSAPHVVAQYVHIPACGLLLVARSRSQYPHVVEPALSGQLTFAPHEDARKPMAMAIPIQLARLQGEARQTPIIGLSRGPCSRRHASVTEAPA